MPQKNDVRVFSSSFDFSKQKKLEIVPTSSQSITSQITHDDLYLLLDKLAKLSNLTISKSEKAIFTKQLIEIINYVGKLNDIDTNGVYPTSQVTGLENVVREDQPSPSLPQEEIMKNAKSKHNGFFKVPAIFNS